MLKKILDPIFSGRPLTVYGSLLIVLMVITWLPLEGRVGFGVIKLGCMISAVLVLLFYAFGMTKALFMGILYVSWQLFSASLHPLSFRFTTIAFSMGFVFTYVCFYNLLYEKHIFTIRHFIALTKWVMMAFFIFCVLQQFCILIGIKYAPAINLTYFVNRGIGCHSLSMEPSTFARTMLVFYYCYLKCCEYVRGEGPFSLKELFQGEYKWVTIRFLWMMTTMGSGTAYICLLTLALYFVRKSNWYYIIPAFIVTYIFILPMVDSTQLHRATSAINATTSLKQDEVEIADEAGSQRISPVINSLNADFTDIDTWLGHGIDYTRDNNMVINQTATLFDDYGFIFYIISLIFNLTCAYRVRSLGFLFMIMGIGGGAGTNIHYTWSLMMVMTCQRYFYDHYHLIDYSVDEDAAEEEEELEEGCEIEKTEFVASTGQIS